MQAVLLVVQIVHLVYYRLFFQFYRQFIWYCRLFFSLYRQFIWNSWRFFLVVQTVHLEFLAVFFSCTDSSFSITGCSFTCTDSSFDITGCSFVLQAVTYFSCISMCMFITKFEYPTLKFLAKKFVESLFHPRELLMKPISCRNSLAKPLPLFS
jgi:hypothetical protein